ncbi:MAG: DUF177 domain-containing protein [Bacteroidales bacterium]|nr:DUF177 domain-containing protein [Bacteroidales bacterium]
MKVPLNGLTQGRTEFRWSVGKEFFASFENSEILDARVEVAATIEKSGRFIGVDCSVEGDVTVLCDRCFEELVLPVSTGFKLSVKFGPEPSDEGLLSEDDREIVFLSDSDTDLDLDQVVYDYVCLSLPVQRVHPEGECNPDALKYLNSESDTETLPSSDSSLPFASLKSLLGNS